MRENAQVEQVRESSQVSDTDPLLRPGQGMQSSLFYL